MFSVNWVQHAVGHGGFHTGHLRGNDNSSFNWIFDCGSRRTAKFDAFLENWTEAHQQTVDWLFISHFDMDHVSGLDVLMSRSVVQNVMVPYVNEEDLAYVLLYEIGRGNLNRNFIELMADPSTFFLSRGASRVIFLGGPPDGEELELEPDPRSPEGASSWSTKISPQPRRLYDRIPSRAALADSSPTYAIPSGECEIYRFRSSAGLLLKPYRLPISHQQHLGLIDELRTIVGYNASASRQVGLGELAHAVALYARTSMGRANLQKLFRNFVSSSNRASLSLLSMPYDGSKALLGDWNVSRPYAQNWGFEGEVGWLNTGDAELLGSDELTDWAKSYADELPTVRVLALPHHGSDRNSNVELQKLCPNATFVAHVKSNSRKHPGPRVALAADQRLVRVTEQPRSEVYMSFQAPWK